jgi:hypothetical protein
MRRYFFLLLVLAFLITAGCVEEVPANISATTVQTTVTIAAGGGSGAGQPPAPSTVPTPPPAEMAYLSGIKCAVGDRSEAAYHCNGNIRIRGGSAFDNVQVLARYPDNNTFRSGDVAMGGSEAVSKPFVVFPDLKYQSQNPAYFVKMDGVLYPVVMTGGDSGTAWSNMPVPDGVDVR